MPSVVNTFLFALALTHQTQSLSFIKQIFSCLHCHCHCHCAGYWPGYTESDWVCDILICVWVLNIEIEYSGLLFIFVMIKDDWWLPNGLTKLRQWLTTDHIKAIIIKVIHHYYQWVNNVKRKQRVWKMTQKVLPIIFHVDISFEMSFCALDEDRYNLFKYRIPTYNNRNPINYFQHNWLYHIYNAGVE